MKTLRGIAIERRGAYWRFDFEANAFLHHMVRNIMGCLLAVGSGRRAPGWMAEVLRRATARRGTDLSGRTACTSSGRTTMRTWAIPDARPGQRLAALIAEAD